MTISRLARAGLGAGLALALAAAGAGAAHAADQITPDQYFGGTVYLADGSTGEDIALDATLDYDYQPIGLPAVGDLDNKFPIPAGAETVRTFIAPQGQEAVVSKWNAYADIGLTPGGVYLPNMTPLNQVGIGSGTPAGTNAVKSAGGDYSIGLAFLKTNNLYVVPGGLYFIHIHVTPGTGSYTYAQVSGGTVVDPPAEPGGQAQGLSAEVTAPPVVDGVLSLVAPASSTSTIGSPAIVGGLSTSTGALGHLTVQDGRAASKPGWTLTTTSVAGFVNGATTIGKQQLGLAPKNVSGVATTLGAAQVAGSATYPSLFAQLPAGSAGDSVLDADLTFVAPSGSPAGTYTSTLTVTLVSQ